MPIHSLVLAAVVLAGCTSPEPLTLAPPRDSSAFRFTRIGLCEDYPEESRSLEAAERDLAYMGTYSDDRQPALDELLLEPARNWDQGRFAVAGPQYPRSIQWPRNVNRFTHLPPAQHRSFYNSQKFTLNITRADMVDMGYSPSVRLFEAAACGTPAISDYWDGLETFFRPDEEILVAHSSEESLYYLLEVSEEERRKLGAKARKRVLARHTSRHRALELENYIFDLLKPAKT